ncbi:TPA: G5 domain-containing protein [Streptococcus pneumoniae]|nr:G5 domain-containing protein [Streptococcus pneumoniae]HEW0528400.1 G5 domain-containing protein [Streptococcus pneumoniae]HEW2407476.1 G5 domain-containing protein [Streptococcus pneumoniae]HEW8579388.1 G5 domain-containing protein [Streptococcus pneumoniae]HEW9824110.1 G5 domain-containing protein [Streptococcus pneumoniae]
MKHSHKKSFDWYSMQQRYSIRKYYFGAVSVLLGTALVLGAAASVQTVQAEENKQETTNSISVGRGEAATKPAEVSASNKEKTYAAPTVANPVETTPVKTGEVTKPAEKVEEAKDKKEEVTHQDAIDKSKLLTALSRAKKLESKLYTEASAANLQTSIQAGQSLLGKADASEAELSAAESSIQSSIIGLELRSNSNKGTVSETPVVKKANIVEAKEETNPAATTDRSAVDSAVLPTSTAAKVETTSAPASINEILKPGLSLSDARQNPAIRKEDVDRGYSGFRAAPAPTNQPVTNLGNNTVFTDISRGSHTFRGNGNSRRGNPIHFDVTTTRVRNRVDFSIRYSGPGEFVNNNFILDKGNGFGEPSRATVSTPKLRDQVKNISKGGNFVSHSGYSLEAAVETSTNQTIKFSLPIANPNGDLSVRLRPVTFNVGQGESGSATSNDPYSNSNYYFREKPLLLDANPNGGTNNKTVSEDIDFQTVYLPTSKLPEGQTRLVREGEKGQRQIIYKVHQLGNETILGLPISNSVIKEVKPRIMQIGVAKDLIDTVKPRVDQNKVGDTNNLTFYLDNDGNGVYTEGVDELVQKIAIKDGAKGEKGDRGERGLTGAQGAKGEKGDRGERGLTGAQGAKGEKGDRGERGLTGAKGEKGDQGERGLTGAQGEKGDRGERGLTGAKGEKGAQGQAGRDGVTPTVTVKDNKNDGTHTITINDGRGNVTSTVVRDGFDGASPLVATQRNDADKTTTVIFYYDKNGNNELDASDKKLKEVVIADGAKGEKGERGDRGETGAAGRDGKTPKITTARGADGRSTDITFTIPGEEPVTVNVKDGKDGRTPNIDLNALAEAAVRLNNQRSGRVRRALSDTPAPTEKPKVIGTRITAYLDNNGNGKYDPGVDEPISSADILNGTDGANGAAGAAGADGRNGAELLSGPKAPTADDGKDGDTYIDATTGDVYKKENGTWDKIGNIRGPQGLKGADGVAGPQGPQGLQGRDGAQGPAGRDGREGVPGPAGRDGRDGAAGRDGRDGRDGKDVLNGKVDPTTEGKDGDKYVNTETGDVFVKNNGTWEKEGNIKGPKGDKGERGEDGKTPEVTVTPGKDGHSTDITFTVPGKDPVTVNVKDGENGLNGKTPKVDLLRVEGQNGNPSHTIVTFYTDENNDGKYTPGTDELLGSEMIKDGAKGADGRDGKSLLTVKDGKETKVYQEDPAHPGQPLNPEKPLAVIKDGVDGVSPTVTAVRKDEEGHKGVEITVDNHDGSQPTTVFVHDGEKGETGATGQDGQTPTITTQRGQDGQSTVVTITTPGKDPVTFTVKDGKNGRDGRTPYIDLNALVDAVRRGARRARSVEANPDEVTASTQPSTTGSTASQPVDGTRITAYFDNNGNGKYDPDVDEVISTADILNGNNGANGAAGHDGRDGRNGAELLSGVTAPTSKDGKDGDTYIDANTGDVYKKENGSWNKIGNIRGPQGTAGEKGATGEKGEKGDNGKDGRAPKIKVEDIALPSRNRRATDAATTPTRNGIRITVYDDVNDNGVYDEDVDKVLNSKDIYNGIDGRDGSAPTITTKDNGDGTHTITVQNPDGSESTTVVKDGKDGKTANITTTENPDGSHTITVTNPDGTTKETVVKNGKDGKTPKVEVTDNNDGTHTVKVTDGDGNVTNAVIKDGKDGKAATATTTENPDGSHRVTITNPDGTKNEFVVKNGRDGVDGRTPTASVRDNGDGSHTIVITNPEGVTTETTVRDGKSPKVTITDEQNGTHKISVLNGDGTTTETIIKDGKSPVATVKDNQDGTYTIRVENGNGTVSETTVRDGKSPTAKVVDNGDGTHTITVVNSDGTTTTTTVRDGKEPKLEVIDNNNGSHTIKVTGADGKETTTTIFDGKSPKANIVDNGDGTHTLTIVDSDGREYKSIIKDGKDGKDGVSPTVTVKNNNDGTHVVTIINPDGSKTEMVIKDGKDGKSPKVSVEDNGNGSHTITIINSDGTVTKTVVKDGKDGRDGKDGKCGCQDKPVTPSNDKPVPPTRNVPQGPTFAMPEPPVHELPEFNGGVPGMPEVNDKPILNIPEVPTQPNPNVPVQPVTPLTSNSVVPTTVKENHGDKLPETGSQSDYISVLLGSGILLSLYVGRRKED